MKNLGREELFDLLERIEEFPELRKYLDHYVARFVAAKDRQALEKLFSAGASANSACPLNDHLRLLLHEYEVEHTLHGPEILAIVELLLKSGADPNRVADNNLRAYDYAVSHKTVDFAGLLERYGVDRSPRKPI